jgi:hypothetical protein
MMKTRSQTAAAAAAAVTADTADTADTAVNDMVSMFDRWKLPL